MLKLRPQNNGFTLVELLVVVAILAVLAVALLPRFLDFSDRTRQVISEKDIRTIHNVVEIWAAQNGYYPSDSANPGIEGSVAAVLQEHGINWTGDSTGLVDPWGNPYAYNIILE